MNKINWVRADGEPEGSKMGYIESMELSSGATVLFDKDEGKIDLLRLLQHTGEKVEVYRDGVLSATNIIDDVGPDEERDNVLTLWMTPVPPEKDANAI